MTRARAPGGRALSLVLAGAALGAGALGHAGPGRLARAQEPAPADGAPAVPPGAVAVVGSVALAQAAVDALVVRGLPRAEALRRLVGQEVLRQRLAALGRDPAALSDAELERGVAEARAALLLRGAPAEAVADLERRRDELRVAVAFSAHVAALVTDEDLAALHGRRRAELASVRLRAILVRVGPTRDAAAARARAAELLARLGPAPEEAAVAALAQEASDDPMALVTAGDTDWVRLRDGRIDPALLGAAVEAGRPGLLPAPVAGRDGLWVAHVLGVRIPPVDDPEVRAQLRREAEARRAADLMDRWLRETPVTYARPSDGR